MGEFERLITGAQCGDLADIRTVLETHPEVINQRDQAGATALHYAARGGHRDVVQELIRRGAEINAADGKFGATPTGWAIEYLREMGGFLGIELEDFAHAIRRGEVNGLQDFCIASLPFVGRLIGKESHSSCWLGNLEIGKSSICLALSSRY